MKTCLSLKGFGQLSKFNGFIVFQISTSIYNIVFLEKTISDWIRMPEMLTTI